MKKKNLLFTLGFVAQIALSFHIAYANPSYPGTQIVVNSVNAGDEITPRANVTGYQYMEIDGILYKRLYPILTEDGKIPIGIRHKPYHTSKLKSILNRRHP